jgi:excisionase family DNA binding protein
MARTPAAVKPDRAARRRKSTPKRKFPTAPALRKPADYLLSTKASCEYLGVSRTTLYDWVRDGLITPTRLGPRMLRFDIADLDALLS